MIADAIPNKCLKSSNIEDITANNCWPEHNYSCNTNNQESYNTNTIEDTSSNNPESSNKKTIEDTSIYNNNCLQEHDYWNNQNTKDSSTNNDNVRLITNCKTTIKHFLSLKKENNRLQTEIKYLKSSAHERSILMKYLNGKTTPATAGMIATGRRGKLMYSREDISVAAVLKSMSRKTYQFLRKKKLLKLPCENTIREWLKDFSLDTNGLQHNLLDIVSAKNMTEADKNLWLAFDEMALREAYVYNGKTKTVLEPAKKLQCVMVRSLISGWKLPVYFSTNENMTIDILSNITAALEARGFTVRGASFDLGNKGFMSQCNFDKGKHYIRHPVDPIKRFYLLPDPPHLIKLLRNHVFSKGVYFPADGFDKVHKKPSDKELNELVKTGKWVFLSRNDFTEILNADSGELKVQHSLTNVHVDVNFSKTNVRIAAQTFSTKTAAAMEFLTPHKKHLAEAIRVTNDVST